MSSTFSEGSDTEPGADRSVTNDLLRNFPAVRQAGVCAGISPRARARPSRARALRVVHRRKLVGRTAFGHSPIHKLLTRELGSNFLSRSRSASNNLDRLATISRLAIRPVVGAPTPAIAVGSRRVRTARPARVLALLGPLHHTCECARVIAAWHAHSGRVRSVCRHRVHVAVMRRDHVVVATWRVRCREPSLDLVGLATMLAASDPAVVGEPRDAAGVDPIVRGTRVQRDGHRADASTRHATRATKGAGQSASAPTAARTWRLERRMAPRAGSAPRTPCLRRSRRGV